MGHSGCPICLASEGTRIGAICGRLDPDPFGAPRSALPSVERRTRSGEITDRYGERQDQQTQVKRRGETLHVLQTGWPF
jgi:hypothetical protein